MKDNRLKEKKPIILRKKLEETTALICHQNCQFDAQRESKCFSAAIMTLNIIPLNCEYCLSEALSLASTL